MRRRRPCDELRGGPRPRRVIGAAIVVWRRTDAGIESLVLHRSQFEPEFAGDWAWGPPGGGCDEGESVEDCARRELREETGIERQVERTECGGADFAVFRCELGLDDEVALSWEHDGYRWLPLEEARALCLPAHVGDQLACVARTIG